MAAPGIFPAGIFQELIFSTMPDSLDVTVLIRQAVNRYKSDGEMSPLQDALSALPDTAPAILAEAVEPFRDMPEVAGPVYERIVAAEPNDARALVILANAYWLSGRGPDVVGELATRAIAADATNRGAWHLWALSEGNPRERTSRWKQVSARFPEDMLARANLADNAAALAGAEQDYEALDLAIENYEELLERSEIPEQREALGKAIATLKAWRF
ncbi:MAG: hypothetical protein ACSLFE_00495 [Gemmatimonadaceae bacterium]